MSWTAESPIEHAERDGCVRRDRTFYDRCSDLKAAHGDYDEYDHKRVASLIGEIRNLAARHPA